LQIYLRYLINDSTKVARLRKKRFVKATGRWRYLRVTRSRSCCCQSQRLHIRDGNIEFTARVTAHLLDHGSTRCTSTHISKCIPLICILILLLSAIRHTLSITAIESKQLRLL